MQPWWHESHEGEEKSFLVVEAKLHEPSAWKLKRLKELSIMVSRATALIMADFKNGLRVTYDLLDETKVASAEVMFRISVEKVPDVQALLAQESKVPTTPEMPSFTNAYRFTACLPDDAGAMVTANLVSGFWMKDKRGEPVHRTTMIAATTALQQLIVVYLGRKHLQMVPSVLRGGIGQEVAQQVGSYLGNLISTKVKNDVSFPTVEDRDPVRRKLAYDTALTALLNDLRPFDRKEAREVFPGEYAEDDPKGDRMLVHDERWYQASRSPEPHPIPLFVVNGKAVKFLEGEAQFAAGISKADRHRGHLVERADVLASRPKGVQKKGHTSARAWYVALPFGKGENVVNGKGRGLDLSLRPMPIMRETKFRMDADDILIPLSGNRDRLESILRNPGYEIAWTRLVQKYGEWFLQLTVRVHTAVPAESKRVLAVAFGIDAVVSWKLVDVGTGEVVQTGYTDPNQQILKFLQEKRKLEWDQQKQRWVGGKEFGKQLEFIAHGVANGLLDLAREHDARLAVEEVSYVQKSGHDSQANVLFTAWNYGQLRRILEYKAPLGKMLTPITCSDYLTRMTCPACGAIRGKNETAEKAKTWREKEVLHCRKCGRSGEVTPMERADRVARHAVEYLRKKQIG